MCSSWGSWRPARLRAECRRQRRAGTDDPPADTDDVAGVDGDRRRLRLHRCRHHVPFRPDAAISERLPDRRLRAVVAAEAVFGQPEFHDPPADQPVYRVDVTGTRVESQPVAGRRPPYYASDGTDAFLRSQGQDAIRHLSPPPASDLVGRTSADVGCVQRQGDPGQHRRCRAGNHTQDAADAGQPELQFELDALGALGGPDCRSDSDHRRGRDVLPAATPGRSRCCRLNQIRGGCPPARRRSASSSSPTAWRGSCREPCGRSLFHVSATSTQTTSRSSSSTTAHPNRSDSNRRLTQRPRSRCTGSIRHRRRRHARPTLASHSLVAS